MALQRDERVAVHEVAVQALKNELELAVRLLRKIRDARDTLVLEQEAVESARNAFRHATEALTRMPQLEAMDMDEVQALMDEFRVALAGLAKHSRDL